MYETSSVVYRGFVRKGSDGTLTGFSAPQAGTITNRGTIPISISGGLWLGSSGMGAV